MSFCLSFVFYFILFLFGGLQRRRGGGPTLTEGCRMAMQKIARRGQNLGKIM